MSNNPQHTWDENNILMMLITRKKMQKLFKSF